MCGICGFFSKNRITEDELRIMNDTMIHRGPNDNGVELYPGKDGYTIGFAQRRLSINDLSPLGHQPMTSANDRISVVFNGEIYNFLELKEELKGYPFKSTCDTEVILAGYLKWGKDLPQHIHGMFAIALYDRETDELLLIRDRIGKKPLYYWYEAGNIVFGSELKPVMKCPGFKGDIRKSIIPRYLYQQYINAPESIFENVWQVEPGQMLVFKNGEVTKTGYWSIKEAYKKGSASMIEDYSEAKAGLKKRLQKSVADRMIADVPLGAFLSGGYDSSLITALAQEHSDSPVKTFSIGFNVPEYNEAEFAKKVAEHLGTDHTELYIDEAEMLELVDSIPDYYDEPFADESQIPTMLVCKLAREKVTVALSGDGGDEFFCGYNVYEHVAKARELDLLGGVVSGVGQIPVGKNKLLTKLPIKVQAVANNRDPETKTQISSPAYIPAAHAFVTGIEEPDQKLTYEQYVNRRFGESGLFPCQYPVESSYEVDDWQVRRMLLDMDTYLPSDILVKMDRASMKYSLECRCPIMDTAVMEYSFSIPHGFKYMNGDKKHILKDITYDYIPKELLDRPKKGFGVPMDAWLRGPLRDSLIDLSNESYLKKQGIFNPEYTSSFIRNYLEKGDGGASTGANFSRLSWSFLSFQKWYERYL
ncbi:asparagine synthase (glutamine-hydrolyzing) [Butyrivibrio sp. INlla16]|uniref:asparagine synthase (glutamine-hydrolyzing) n=1 Tax=Butyrivibrio sp. INlla16 TaxID=1520807 RepID=UPI000883E5A5|nr:asparagine synthase (glutamine-hydrolyzing) [Butyrivibrio sp. INlla16]SDB48026.1 asparagine synthase (glutamine-hydrolysing) [Butyrivibrio sp. INlla16]